MFYIERVLYGTSSLRRGACDTDIVMAQVEEAFTNYSWRDKPQDVYTTQEVSRTRAKSSEIGSSPHSLTREER